MEIKSLYKKFLKYSKPTAPKSKVQSKKIDMSKRGLWDKNKNKVIVPSNRITMKGPKGEQDFFKRPVLATGLQSGKQVLMQPGREYYFPNDEQVFEKRMQDGGTVQTNMLQPIKKDEESLPIILESLFSQFQKSKEEFGVEPEESESMGTPSLQDGALVKDEDIRMDPIEINAELPPWYIRYPRKALRAANAKLEDWGAQYAQKISDATGGKDWYKEANPFGSLALEFMNAPQYTATYGVTGKVQTPSEAMDIQNPYGAFAVDALLDPMNVVGVGVSSKARNLFSQVPDQLNSSIARQINKNPRLALSLQRGRPINTSNVSIISGINPGDVSAFPDMVKRINPNTVSESTFFKQLEKGSTSLDSSLQKRISDLESKEGFKRLVDQEKDYLFYNSDLPEDTIERVAKINARSRIDELKNMITYYPMIPYDFLFLIVT